MIGRYALVGVLLLAALAVRIRVTPEDVAQPQPLSTVPLALSAWRGHDVPLDAEIVDALGVDDHLHRYYRSRDALVNLYVAYYRSQRPGRAIHSPMNCMPGAGWQPIKLDRVAVRDDSDAESGTVAAAGSRTINRVVIEKGGERQLVLYWYQTVDRVTASEYLSKVWLVADAFRSGRTDVALVRVAMPIDRHDPQGETKAFEIALPFATRMLPVLGTKLFQS